MVLFIYVHAPVTTKFKLQSLTRSCFSGAFVQSNISNLNRNIISSLGLFQAFLFIFPRWLSWSLMKSAAAVTDFLKRGRWQLEQTYSLLRTSQHCSQKPRPSHESINFFLLVNLYLLLMLSALRLSSLPTFLILWLNFSWADKLSLFLFGSWALFDQCLLPFEVISPALFFDAKVSQAPDYSSTYPVCPSVVYY